ncbi:hypothetical protein [Curtobacterium poinsettiae]|nr:hypothetical protein [Curtobacterium flaccumfaciens]MBT1611893.1 hypothetical protein [Curtobacterium flaccumfaciens pv. poinsettiae]
MKDRAAQLRPVDVAPAVDPPSEPERQAEPAPARSSDALVLSRINFEIPKGTRAAFKMWCIEHDTTIKDELTAYIEQRIRSTQ